MPKKYQEYDPEDDNDIDDLFDDADSHEHHHHTHDEHDHEHHDHEHHEHEHDHEHHDHEHHEHEHDHEHHDHEHHEHELSSPEEIRKRARLFTLADFLHFFPEAALPITLSEDDALMYSQHNDLLPGPVTFQFIVSYETSDPDGYTEYVPCFRLPTTQQYEAIVFWKAELLENGFFLATYTKDGRQISCNRIAGMRLDGDKVIQSVATVEASRQVYTVEGSTATDLTGFDATATRPAIVYIGEDGVITSS
jgi:hypothetical protein